MISNGDKNYNRKRVGSYSVCNQTSDLRNRTNDKWESDFLITRMITNNRTARNQKSKKKLQNKLAIGSTERTINSAKSATATRACNALSAPLLCPSTSMTRTLFVLEFPRCSPLLLAPSFLLCLYSLFLFHKRVMRFAECIDILLMSYYP